MQAQIGSLACPYFYPVFPQFAICMFNPGYQRLGFDNLLHLTIAPVDSQPALRRNKQRRATVIIHHELDGVVELEGVVELDGLVELDGVVELDGLVELDGGVAGLSTGLRP